jgi:hypothetical protein
VVEVTILKATVAFLVRCSTLLLTQSHYFDDGSMVHVHMIITGLCLTTMRHKANVGAR